MSLTTPVAASVAHYTASLDDAVSRVVHEAAATVPAFAARLAAAGLSAESISGVAGLAALPILTKDDVLAQQQAEPPFGGLLAPGARVSRVFQSPGPLYEPQLSAPTPGAGDKRCPPWVLAPTTPSSTASATTCRRP